MWENSQLVLVSSMVHTVADFQGALHITGPSMDMREKRSMQEVLHQLDVIPKVLYVLRSKQFHYSIGKAPVLASIKKNIGGYWTRIGR